MATISTLKNRYLNKSIFSLSIGPSLATLALDKLKDKYTCGMKLIPVQYFTPTFFVCLEEWTEIPASIWEDKQLIKFVPEGILEKGYLKPHGSIFRSEPLKNVPNVFSFQLGECFKSSTYLSEKCITWGCKKNYRDEFGIRGRRSIFLALFKLYYVLGFRKIYLCGVDFSMSKEQPYCYKREKSEIAVSENNILYKTLSRRLESLVPYFQDAGLEVYNCNPNSHLTVFPYKAFEECLAESESV